MHYLSIMTDEQTLVMYSGHPLGLFPSSPSSPRAVITNGMVGSLRRDFVRPETFCTVSLRLYIIHLPSNIPPMQAFISSADTDQYPVSSVHYLKWNNTRATKLLRRVTKSDFKNKLRTLPPNLKI